MASKPLADAEVQFVPDGSDGRAATGKTDSSGRFTLGTFETGDGALPGKYKVSIIAKGPDKEIPAAKKGKMLAEDTQGSGDPLILPKYFDAASSGLAAEVSSSGGKFDFTVEPVGSASPPKAP